MLRDKEPLRRSHRTHQSRPARFRLCLWSEWMARTKSAVASVATSNPSPTISAMKSTFPQPPLSARCCFPLGSGCALIISSSTLSLCFSPLTLNRTPRSALVTEHEMRSAAGPSFSASRLPAIFVLTSEALDKISSSSVASAPLRFRGQKDRRQSGDNGLVLGRERGFPSFFTKDLGDQRGHVWNRHLNRLAALVSEPGRKLSLQPARREDALARGQIFTWAGLAARPRSDEPVSGLDWGVKRAE